MTTKTNRDAKLDELKAATELWYKKRIAQLDRQQVLLEGIIKSRGKLGASKNRTNQVAKKFIVDSIDELLEDS